MRNCHTRFNTIPTSILTLHCFQAVGGDLDNLLDDSFLHEIPNLNLKHDGNQGELVTGKPNPDPTYDADPNPNPILTHRELDVDSIPPQRRTKNSKSNGWSKPKAL